VTPRFSTILASLALWASFVGFIVSRYSMGYGGAAVGLCLVLVVGLGIAAVAFRVRGL
jgi:hypothetical protein